MSKSIGVSCPCLAQTAWQPLMLYPIMSSSFLVRTLCVQNAFLVNISEITSSRLFCEFHSSPNSHLSNQKLTSEFCDGPVGTYFELFCHKVLYHVARGRWVANPHTL